MNDEYRGLQASDEFETAVDCFQFIHDHNAKNANGTLTVGDTIMGRYYRLRNGEHAGRVIIRSGDRIDGEPIIRYANGLTWTLFEKLRDILCEEVRPSFSMSELSIDYSQATWYDDNSDTPRHHEW